MTKLPQINLYIGSKFDLSQTDEQDWAFVHAAKTAHYQKMSWNYKNSRMYQNHPNYIFFENSNHMSINWVDSNSPALYEWTTPQGFVRVLDFIDKWIKNRKVFIHCDQGQSRAPTVGLLYLAKRAKKIPNDSFLSAQREFDKIYPQYLPKGIGLYVEKHWDEIN